VSETPHCPLCGRADCVDPRKGSTTYEWVCTNVRCGKNVITQRGVRDVPFMDMSRSWDMADIEQTDEQTYSDDCECDWCERGRPYPDHL